MDQAALIAGDWGHSLVIWAQTVFNIATPAIAAWLGAAAIAYLKKKHVNNAIINALGRAAGEGNRLLLENGKKITDPGVMAAMIQAGTEYMFATVPQSLASEGKDNAETARMVAAEIGRQLLASSAVPVAAISEAIAPAVSDAIIPAVSDAIAPLVSQPPIVAAPPEPVPPPPPPAPVLSEDAMRKMAEAIARDLAIQFQAQSARPDTVSVEHPV
jgi:hypothetical protein